MSLSMEEKVKQVLEAAARVVFGQEELIEALLAALICEGHLLIEGMPGLGKTLSVAIMAELMDLNFRRIQFTPDLLPSDLIGTMVFNQSKDEFTTRFGPIFTQILLADEINRAPAKVQSALLESMAEKQVTIGEQTHRLQDPFVVLATQNPIDQEGTYALPEAQMDRFMMKLRVPYPDFSAEVKVLTANSWHREKLQPLLGQADLMALKQKVQQIYVDEKIKEFIVRTVQATRPQSSSFPLELRGVVAAGASPRASLWLFTLSKFRAFREGKDFVTPEHVLHYIPAVLGHRVVLSYEASMDHLDQQSLCLKLAQSLI